MKWESHRDLMGVKETTDPKKKEEYLNKTLLQRSKEMQDEQDRMDAEKHRINSALQFVTKGLEQFQEIANSYASMYHNEYDGVYDDEAKELDNIAKNVKSYQKALESAREKLRREFGIGVILGFAYCETCDTFSSTQLEDEYKERWLEGHTKRHEIEKSQGQIVK